MTEFESYLILFNLWVLGLLPGPDFLVNRTSAHNYEVCRLRFFAVFFGIVAICWIGIIAFSSDPKQLTLSVFGYFLALWAVRAPLAAGAPKLTTLMDYVILGLYALLIAIAAAKFIWGFKRTAASTSS